MQLAAPEDRLATMQVMLVYASAPEIGRFGGTRREFPPIGLLYVAASLERAGFGVKIHELGNTSDDELRGSGVIGLSINSSYVYPLFLERSDVLRSSCRVLVAGGQHASAYSEKTLRDLQLDYVICGEAERSFPLLLDAISRRMSPSSIPGVGCVVGREFRLCVPDRISDLDRLPFPARHLLPDSAVLLDNRMPGDTALSVALITSRGCPCSCAFCGNRYKKFIARSRESVARELEAIVGDYGVDSVVLLDENLLYDTEHLHDVCAGLRDKNLGWTANSRVDSFSRDKVMRMRESGCREIKFGLESGSASMLRRMHKGITPDDIRKAIRGTSAAGIRTKAFLMYGFPGDDRRTAQETISLLDELGDDLHRANLFSFAPLPNSPAYRNASEYGIRTLGDLRAYRLYGQPSHWWGSEADHQEVVQGFRRLAEYMQENYAERDPRPSGE